MAWQRARARAVRAQRARAQALSPRAAYRRVRGARSNPAREPPFRRGSARPLLCRGLRGDRELRRHGPTARARPTHGKRAGRTRWASRALEGVALDLNRLSLVSRQTLVLKANRRLARSAIDG